MNAERLNIGPNVWSCIARGLSLNNGLRKTYRTQKAAPEFRSCVWTTLSSLQPEAMNLGTM